MAMCQIGQVRPFGDESLQSTRMIPVRSLCLITIAMSSTQNLSTQIADALVQDVPHSCFWTPNSIRRNDAKKKGFRRHGGTPKSSKSWMTMTTGIETHGDWGIPILGNYPIFIWFQWILEDSIQYEKIKVSLPLKHVSVCYCMKIQWLYWKFHWVKLKRKLWENIGYSDPVSINVQKRLL